MNRESKETYGKTRIQSSLMNRLSQFAEYIHWRPVRETPAIRAAKKGFHSPDGTSWTGVKDFLVPRLFPKILMGDDLFIKTRFISKGIGLTPIDKCPMDYRLIYMKALMEIESALFAGKPV